MLVALAAIAACSSSPDAAEPAPTSAVEPPTPTASESPESTDPSATVPQSDEAVAAPCEARVVVDEYGFPITVELCEAPEDQESATVTDLLARVPSDVSRAALDAGHEAATRLADACGDLGSWSAQAERLLPGLEATVDRVSTDPALVDWLGGPDARTLADEFRELLILPTGCDADGVAGAVDRATALEVAGRLAGTNDDLTFALDDPGQILFASDFWYATDQLGHLVDTSLLLETRPIDILLMGPSTVKRGIDPVQLENAVGRTVYNAAVGAMAPDLQLGWYRELRESGVRPDTVVIGLNTWIEFLPCESPQKDRAEETDTRRAAAFSNIDALAQDAGGTRLIGGPLLSYEGRALDAHRATWIPNTGGRIELSDEYEQGVADIQADQYEPLPYDELCPDRLDRIEALAAEIVGDGSDVVLLVLPTSDAVAEFHPDGRTGHDAVIERYRTIAETTGAFLLDTSDLVDEALYVDLTHVGNAGRAVTTEALVPAVGGTAS